MHERARNTGCHSVLTSDIEAVNERADSVKVRSDQVISHTVHALQPHQADHLLDSQTA